MSDNPINPCDVDQFVEKDPALPFLRITVLGCAGCGKTSLINAFVNNFFPTVHTSTDDPTLYYKTLQIHSDDAAKSLMCEIEDTYAFDRRDGKDIFGVKRDIRNFLDMTVHSHVQPGTLSTHRPPPLEAHKPMSRARMGFMLVYDALSEESLKEVGDAVLQLEKDVKSGKFTEKPVIYLVGNKVDKLKSAQNDSEHTKTTLRAKGLERMHGDANAPIRHPAPISAFELKKVRAIFRSMLKDIYEREPLWKGDGQSTHRHRHSSVSSETAIPVSELQDPVATAIPEKKQDCAVM